MSSEVTPSTKHESVPPEPKKPFKYWSFEKAQREIKKPVISGNTVKSEITADQPVPANKAKPVGRLVKYAPGEMPVADPRHEPFSNASIQRDIKRFASERVRFRSCGYLGAVYNGKMYFSYRAYPR